MDEAWIVERDDFQQLIDALLARQWCVIAPTVQEGAIVYDEVTRVAELPVGWTDEQAGGHYRLHRRTDQALFGYVVGPQSWKKYLHPPRIQLWRARRCADGLQITPPAEPPPRLALLGVRACELRAIAIQDGVLLNGQYTDPVYQARRENVFIIAVNCGQAGGTCFCVSMNTGPAVRAGFDLALTEVVEEGRHYFVGETGTERGAELMRSVPHQRAADSARQKAAAIVAQAAQQMGRTMETDGLPALLYRNYEHPRWHDVAARCLTCANCTMVCPTCFCTTVEDTTDLTGEHAERWRRWDSCFTLDFSYVHGGSVRASARARYRQWMTHKLATWHAQFDSSGCVGCGRCITWCPVGIDLTEEVRAIRASEGTVAPKEEDGNA